jgi:hypothetical protein
MHAWMHAAAQGAVRTCTNKLIYIRDQPYFYIID